MNKSYFLFLIPLFFIIPLAFAQESNYYRGYDWDESINPITGSITRTLGLDPWITTNESVYVPQITNENSNVIQIESELVSFVFDKSTCGISIFESGRIGLPIYDNENNQIGFKNNIPFLTSESWTTKFALNNTNNWITVPWNNEPCTTNLIKNSTGDYIEALKQNPQGHTKLTYAKPFGKELETFTEIFNNDNAKNNHKFGSDQSLIKANGVSHNHDIENDRIIFTSPEGKQYALDYSKAKSEYWGLNINNNDLNLDFKGVNDILPPGQKKVLDPTFGLFLSDEMNLLSNAQAGSTCHAVWGTTTSDNVETADSDLSAKCRMHAVQWDMSNFPMTADVTATVFSFEITAGSTPKPCTFTRLNEDILTASGQDVADDILTLTEFVTSNTDCQSIGSYTSDLGASANTQAELAIQSGGTFAVGIRPDNMTRSTVINRSTFDQTSYAITITYDMPPEPALIFNATQQTVYPYTVDLEWNRGTNNGKSFAQTHVERYDGSNWIQLASVSATTFDYADTNPLKQTTAQYRILLRNTLGSFPAFPINQTLGDNLISHFWLDYQVTDAGLLNNDASVIGNELYVNATTDADFPIFGFDFDGASYITLPNESDYDITDNAFSIVGEAEINQAGSVFHTLYAKRQASSPEGIGFFINSAEQLELQLTNSPASDELRVRSNHIWTPATIYHFVLTHDGSGTNAGTNFYINGVVTTKQLVYDTLTSTSLNNAVPTIGRDDVGSFVDGQIYELMIFDTELTAHDVLNLYNQRIDTRHTPDTPTLGSVELSETAIRFTSVAGADNGEYPVKDYGLQCELNGSGGWLNTVNNSTLPGNRAYDYTGLSPNDIVICQWWDGSLAGRTAWSNNSTGTAVLAIIQTERADTADHLKNFETFIEDQGGVYFGLTLFPFITMLVGFMAGKKTVRIFTLIILFMMGIFHASGFFVYPDWYWALAMLFGLGLVLGRQRSD